MKLGFPPFHYWFINIINNITWLNCLILSTWQKIIPIIIIILIFIKNLCFISLIYGSILRTTLNLNHQSLRIIFRYSSINHIRWILLNLIIREILWIIYFLIYTIINRRIILTINIYKIIYINQINIIQRKQINLIILFNLISISGLPPIFGFNIKWLRTYFYLSNNITLINIIIIIISILTFIIYTRILISFLLRPNKNKLNITNKFNKYIYTINNISFLNLWAIRIWLF